MAVAGTVVAGLSASAIEDYAVVGNGQSLALVGRDGSIDWLCLPRFDSPACFAALLGTPEHGRWLIAPTEASAYAVRRAYRANTLVLETLFEGAQGATRIIDFMTHSSGASHLVRIVEGVRGSVPVQVEFILRFDYGSMVPWGSRVSDGRVQFVAGPDRVFLDSAVPLRGEGLRTLAQFSIKAGETRPFVFSYNSSHVSPPERLDALQELKRSTDSWRSWCERADVASEFAPVVLRSLLTLKCLTHTDTGGIVAAGTTSLPEKLNGVRNWDYRFCWLRDATFTLYALLGAGYLEEARAWREWLLRAVGGAPELVQTMYGVAGERRCPEQELPWLPGFAGSSPVRIGNAATGQLQLDIYGEVIDSLYVARKAGLADESASWALEVALLAQLETIWCQPDNGIWEMRGEPMHFTHSKVMCWVAFDRMIRAAEEFHLPAPLERWRDVRATIHREVCERGYSQEQNAFVQSYEHAVMDASLLLLLQVGFLPARDPRLLGTVAAIERRLLVEGLVLRYDSGKGDDGLPPGEGAFLACSFWLADAYVLQGRLDDARALLQRLMGLCNDVGLLAEEYDPRAKRQLGNFPQAFSHLALVNTARNLQGHGPAHHRSGGKGAVR